MIAELVDYEPDDPDSWVSSRIERRQNVYSVSVVLAECDRGTYPRIGINTPSCYSSLSLRPDGPERLEVFSDDAHSARESSVCGPEERWLRTVIPEDLRRELDRFVNYEALGYTNNSDVVETALRRFLESERDTE